jgi:hypothetical protein
MDLLTSYTYESELQAITAPPLISTIHKPPQHSLSLFQPVVSSPGVPWQRLRAVEILQLHALMSLPAGHRLATELTLSNISARTTYNHPVYTVAVQTVALLRMYYLAIGTCSPTRCPETVNVYRVTAQQLVHTPQYLKLIILRIKY